MASAVKEADAPAPIIARILVNRRELADRAGVDPSTVGDLTTKGVLTKAAAGKYDLVDALARMCRHFEERARRVGTSGVNVTDERGALLRAQREFAELRVRQATGDLVSMTETEAAWARVVASIRQAVLGIPTGLRFELPHLTGHDQRVATRLCREILEDLSEGKPPKFEEVA